MKWRRRNDYNGSRTYGADEPVGSRLRLDLAVLVGWAKQHLEKLMRAGAPRSNEFRTLVHAKEKNFSMLGAANENRREIPNSIWGSETAHAWWRDLEAGSQPRV